MSKHPAHLLGIAQFALEQVVNARDLETARRDAAEALAAINEHIAQADEGGVARGRRQLFLATAEHQLGPVGAERTSFAASVIETQLEDRRLGRGLSELLTTNGGASA